MLAGSLDSLTISVEAETVEIHTGLARWPLDVFARRFPTGHVVPGIRDPRSRRQACERARAAGLRLMQAIDPRAHLGHRIRIGEGSVICAGTIMAGDVTIGDGVRIDASCAVGHDCIIGDYVNLEAGVRLGGCIVGEGVVFGMNTVVLPGLNIGAGATVSPGAVVVRDVSPGATMGGVPAVPRR